MTMLEGQVPTLINRLLWPTRNAGTINPKPNPKPNPNPNSPNQRRATLTITSELTLTSFINAMKKNLIAG